MLKQVLTGASILALTFISYLPAQAQTQAPAPKPPAPAAPQAQFSSQELEKFAKAIEQLLKIQQDTNQQMIQAIQQTGLSPARFDEIYKAQQNSQPPTATPKPVSQDEKQKFTQALTKLTAIDQQAQPKMKKAVQDQGLELQRFDQIMAAVQQNPDLQQQVKKLIRG